MFNKAYTQYIPVSLTQVGVWLGNLGLWYGIVRQLGIWSIKFRSWGRRRTINTVPVSLRALSLHALQSSKRPHQNPDVKFLPSFSAIQFNSELARLTSHFLSTPTSPQIYSPAASPLPSKSDSDSSSSDTFSKQTSLPKCSPTSQESSTTKEPPWENSTGFSQQ